MPASRVGNWALLFVFVLSIPVFSAGSFAAEVAPGVSIESAPKWAGVEADYTPPASEPYAEGGVFYHQIVDYFRPAEDAVFSRLVMEFQSQTGVSDNSTLTWNVDPEFEQISLHWIRVYRDGEWIDLLPTVDIDVVDARTDVQSWFYDDSKDVRIILERIQVGDVLDYGFTRSGSNPVVGDFFSGSASLGFFVPVGQIEVRVDWPLDRGDLRFRTYPDRIEPEILERDDHRIYRWEVEDAEPVFFENGIPLTHEIFPWVQFSDWPDWGAVAQWAVELYEVSGELPPDLRKKADEIRSSVTDPMERATEALQYVQDAIRYVSIPVGPHSYKPYPVSEIADRQYGDCKDKSLLLVLLLREFGIRADFVLVNTEDGQLLQSRLPTQSAFDHVIVRAVIEGETVWMDPTDSDEGGVLPNRYMGDFGYGLLVSPETEDLIANVGPQAASEAETSITEIFTFTDFGGSVDLAVRTEFRGRDADGFRWDLAMDGLGQLTRTYSNYYATLYDAIPEVDPMAVDDDRRENVIHLREDYRFPILIERGEEGETGVVNFSAEVIRSHLPIPDEKIRSSPFDLPTPLRQNQRIIVHLPDDSVFEDEDFELENEWLSYRFSVRQEGRRLKIEHRFEILANVVPTENLGEYLDSINQVDEYLDYVIEIDWSLIDSPTSGGLLSALATAFSEPIESEVSVDPAPMEDESPEVREGRGEPEGVALPWVVVIATGSFLLGILFSAIFVSGRGSR